MRYAKFNMINNSLKTIREEISHLSKNELEEICIQLAKFKKENKEFLSYILFDINNEENFASQLEIELQSLFSEVNIKSAYYAKKQIRKIIKTASRYLKYTKVKETHVRLYIYILKEFKALNISYSANSALQKIEINLKNKICNLIEGLHEDLQYDYKQLFKDL